MGHSLAGGAEAFVHMAGGGGGGDGGHLLSKSRDTSDLPNTKVKQAGLSRATREISFSLGFPMNLHFEL